MLTVLICREFFIKKQEVNYAKPNKTATINEVRNKNSKCCKTAKNASRLRKVQQMHFR